MQLLILCEPFKNESLESYLLRVALNNGVERFESIIGTAKIFLQNENPYTVHDLPNKLSTFNFYHANVSSSQHLKAVISFSKLLKLDIKDLLRKAIYRTPQKFSNRDGAVLFDGICIPRKFLRINSIPVCPECLSESIHIRQSWHFSPINCCSKHKLKLIDICPSCEKPINFMDSNLIDKCHCDCDFKKLESVSADKSELDLANWLEGIDYSYLPNVSQSYRWGLLNWFVHHKNNETEGNWQVLAHQFLDYFRELKLNLFNDMDSAWQHAMDTAIKPIDEMSFEDAFGNLLIFSACIPGNDFKQNPALSLIYQYFDNCFIEGNEKLQLRVNAFTVALLLNTTIEQVAILLDQGILKTVFRISSKKPLSPYIAVFRLQEVFSVWLCHFQNEVNHRNVYLSRW